MTTLRQGDRGPAVRELQTLLAMTGHDPGPLDGVFGPRTQAAYTAATASTFAHDEDIADLRSLPRRAVELPRILTPITPVDMRIALCAGYAFVFGDVAEATVEAARAVRVALAQFCVEHGCQPWDGRLWAELDDKGLLPRPWLTPFAAGAPTYIYVWNNNIGNRQVSAHDRERGPVPMAIGIHPGPVAAMQRPLDPHGAPQVPWFSMSPVEGSGSAAHPATSAHYAYPSAAEGAAAYWRFLRNHCAAALAAFEAGDPAKAAHELKVGRWSYSGSEVEYRRAMVDRFRGIE